jgi:hypothetical protein
MHLRCMSCFIWQQCICAIRHACYVVTLLSSTQPMQLLSALSMHSCACMCSLGAWGQHRTLRCCEGPAPCCGVVACPGHADQVDIYWSYNGKGSVAPDASPALSVVTACKQPAHWVVGCTIQASLSGAGGGHYKTRLLQIAHCRSLNCSRFYSLGAHRWTQRANLALLWHSTSQA